MNEEKILSLLQDIKGDVANVHATMATKADVQAVQSDVTDLKSDVKVLKTDVADLKTDVKVLKSDVTDLKSSQQNIVQKLVEHDDRLDRIEQTMATKDDINRLTGSIENLTTVVKQVREDQLFIIEWIKRLQSQIDDQQKVINQQAEEIRKIKLHLQLA